MGHDMIGKVAWVTGGGSGVGRAVAQVLARAGVHVYVSGRRARQLDDTVEKIRKEGGRCKAIGCDISNPNAVAHVVQTILIEQDRIDIYIGAAGYNINRRQFSNLKPEEASDIIATNLTGAFNASSAVLAAMRPRREGVLIHIGSWSGRRVRPFSGPAYTAAKAGLLAMSEALNLEVALEGIRSTVIVPGGIDTPLLDNLPDPPSPDVRAQLLRPEDCAEAALWVARQPARVRIDEIIITPTVQNV
ncbi:SDR family oxidoreductase [Novosphingobium sp. Chol11]|uniref:SDR family oxidoreductase n=1 Tax=Novosphingobium sp. Chol11 TaxID=1385763 RepID=UPI000BE254FD|nr:SDR family oxidoreductase [Novosphingobium sp. Chol11]